MKRVLVVILSMLLATANGFAEYPLKTVEKSTKDSLCLENQNELIAEIYSRLDLIFSANTETRAYELSEEVVASKVRNDIITRIDAFELMEEAMGCHFDDVENWPEIDSVAVSGDHTITASVYVTTAINYHYPEIENSNDYALIGVNHEMAFERSEDGLRLIRDSFDERDVTGVVSWDILESEMESPERGTITGAEYDPENGLRTGFSMDDYDVLGVLYYAITYCGFANYIRRYHSIDGIDTHSYPGSSISHGYSNYNHSYDHPEVTTRDGANYVSQCLNAGGMPTDSLWYPSYNSSPWITASSLVSYLTQTMQYGSAESLSYPYSGVYPGNVVYMKDSSSNIFQVAMCVGYNSAGVPVVCTHTTDVYRLPVSAYISNLYAASLGTVKLTTSNHHTSHTMLSSWYYDSTYHYHLCMYCEHPYGIGAHVPGIYGDCDICGALGPF